MFFKKASALKDVPTTASDGAMHSTLLEEAKDGFHCGFADKECGMVKMLAKHWQRDLAEVEASRARIRELEGKLSAMNEYHAEMKEQWVDNNNRLTADNAALREWQEKAREAMIAAISCLTMHYESASCRDMAIEALRDLVGELPEPPEVQ